MGQLAHKLAESNIQPIFAVTKRMVKTYEVGGVGPPGQGGRGRVGGTRTLHARAELCAGGGGGPGARSGLLCGWRKEEGRSLLLKSSHRVSVFATT